jgi:hypothetical protein
MQTGYDGTLSSVLKSTWFGISTVSPFLVITALGRIAAETKIGVE